MSNSITLCKIINADSMPVNFLYFQIAIYQEDKIIPGLEKFKPFFRESEINGRFIPVLGYDQLGCTNFRYKTSCDRDYLIESFRFYSSENNFDTCGWEERFDLLLSIDEAKKFTKRFIHDDYAGVVYDIIGIWENHPEKDLCFCSIY